MGVDFYRKAIEFREKYRRPGMIFENTMQTNGTATLFINDKQVGQQDIKTQLGALSVAGEGFMVGRCAGAPVTPDFPGNHPWAFSAGDIKKLVVDVSGEAYVDLEMEALAAMKRD